MSEAIPFQLQERHRLIVKGWLESLGVLCDCDNGERRMVHPEHEVGMTARCDRCVLVEVGGIRVRVLRLRSVMVDPDEPGYVALPAVEVTE